MIWIIGFVISCIGGGLLGVGAVKYLYEDDYALLVFLGGLVLTVIGWAMNGVFPWP